MHRPRILIADDDPMIRDMACRALESGSYEVQAVSNGETCLAAAMREQPDLLLLDTLLPDCDSLEIARQLRSQPATRSIPIIALTGFRGVNGSGQWYLNGHAEDVQVEDYAAKPFSPDLLLSKVRHVLERHSG